MHVNLAPGQIDISKTPDLATLQKELAEALTRYKGAEQECSAARSREAGALNALNAAQKKLDDALTTLKATAPHQTNWANQRRERVPSE